ncbi:MAG TPA: class I SAM-dependent methyltransferase [Longimicrobiales bacterium]|nr:class I SAM-dependent methyltransferase [Longimicrobiales bacterium]
MRVGERILAALSRSPAEGDLEEAADGWTVENALDGLRRYFPDLAGLVRGRRVLDFGCGAGWQAVALAREGAASVVGLDTNEAALAGARELAAGLGLGEDRVRFVARLPAEWLGGFDVVVSQNAMEHFAEPEAVLRAMCGALRPGGRIVMTFGPPWYAPTGSHMHFFTRVPWVNLVFSERTVLAVRSRYRSDGATRYEEVESGLNRMSVGRFERITRGLGLGVERRYYRCVRGLDFLGRIPLARELFINNVSCVLVPMGGGPAVPRAAS